MSSSSSNIHQHHQDQHHVQQQILLASPYEKKIWSPPPPHSHVDETSSTVLQNAQAPPTTPGPTANQEFATAGLPHLTPSQAPPISHGHTTPVGGGPLPGPHIFTPQQQTGATTPYYDTIKFSM